MPEGIKTHRHTKASMFPMMELYEESDLPRKQFCKEMDIPLHTFTYWLNKFRKSKMHPSAPHVNKEFVKLEILPPTSLVGNIRISYPNGTVVELPVG
jgi:hypothetical protein